MVGGRPETLLPFLGVLSQSIDELVGSIIEGQAIRSDREPRQHQ